MTCELSALTPYSLSHDATLVGDDSGEALLADTLVDPEDSEPMVDLPAEALVDPDDDDDDEPLSGLPAEPNLNAPPTLLYSEEPVVDFDDAQPMDLKRLR